MNARVYLGIIKVKADNNNNNNNQMYLFCSYACNAMRNCALCLRLICDDIIARCESHGIARIFVCVSIERFVDYNGA